MNTGDLIKNLAIRAVRLEAIEGRLRVDAPVGVLTDEDRRALSVQKTKLLALLSVPAESKPMRNSGPDNGNANPQKKELSFVTVIQAARRDRFGPSEWPEDPEACRELGIHFDRIDAAFLAENPEALGQAVQEALEFINRLAPSASMAAPPAEVLSAWRREQSSAPIPTPKRRSESKAEERIWTPVLFEE
jgi:hypothetical protein